MHEFDRVTRNSASVGAHPPGDLRQIPVPPAPGAASHAEAWYGQHLTDIPRSGPPSLPIANIRHDIGRPTPPLPSYIAHAPHRPAVQRISGRILRLVDLARDIVELTIAPTERLDVLPGQFCRFTFQGFPARCFSPTAPLGAVRDDGYLHLHVKRVRGGQVTPHLGKSIKAGHPVLIEGPAGPVIPRHVHASRLVLIGSGTGFAPIWSIAIAALREMPARPIVIAGAAPTLETFYMAPALELARRYPSVSIIAAVDEIMEPWHGFLPGGPIQHLPHLSSSDVVYVAGGSALARAAEVIAAEAGAALYVVPFTPAAPAQEGWLESARRWLSVG
ncbi:MAG: FAD-binding oxidoreductase [Hyphomicrobiaceae bacterium]